ncbi:DUF924 family protein [Aurantivibrio infirmus]
MQQDQQIIDFWFQELTPKSWWVKDSALDEEIRLRFGDIHRSAAQCELYSWRLTAQGRLAEIIILDQFSRNIFRDNAQAWACDPLALALAQEAVAIGADQELPPAQRTFIYMPYMHSESLVVHRQAMELFSNNKGENNIEHERKHKEIIDRFGRYPHRNEILGRKSTEEELEFLQSPGSSF